MPSIDFLITALVVVLIPGTGVMYTIHTGLLQKKRYAVAAAFGCTLGIVPHCIASILGLSLLLNMGAQVFSTLKLLGAGYLFYLAWKTWKTAGSMEMGEPTASLPFRKVIVDGILLNLLNPKLTLFFVSFLPQYVPMGETNTLQALILLSFVFMLLTLIVFIGYGLLANLVRELVIKKRQIMLHVERGFACFFAALAVKLALSDR
ncbi:LysE family translocator [uncultured Sphaerochaeta sp.]|uniref:LysE family translocator n=1 Tax=uncultured Sphaerochaeta sp. TaxID=886478 RepID=UPI002A0A1FC8|nr:LysE family translocator [uncultured Sphaerochaeta sp.]